MLLLATLFIIFVGSNAQHGTLIAVGGDLTSTRLYSFIANTCKKNPGKLLITTAASFPYSWDCKEYPKDCNKPSESNSKENAIFYEQKFQSEGVSTEWIPADVSNTTAAHSQEWVSRINNGDFCGVFFSGGDQMRYIQTFRGTPVIKAILDRYHNNGMMISGSSAGSEIQTGADMITGGLSWWALDDRPHPDENRTDNDLTYDTIGGWNTFPNGILDTHVGQRGRQARLAMVAWKTYRNFGFGIDQDTALIYDGSDIVQVMGDTGVTIVDTTNTQSVYYGNDFGLTNVTLHYITDGDSWNLSTGKPIWASDKTNILHKESRNYAETTDDVFSYNKEMTFITMAGSMVNSHYSNSICGTSYNGPPTYKACCYFTSDLVGYYKELSGGSRLISWYGMQVNFVPDKSNFY